MSPIQRSVIVVPSYAIEDLPTGVGHETAADFLAAWTVGWDPRLLVALNALPEWKRSDSSSLELESSLVVIPEWSRDKVDQPQRERLTLGKCLTIDSNGKKRSDLFEAIAKGLADEDVEIPNSLPLCLSDFYALGYAVLQIQIMARKLRYSWNLDWLAFSEQVLSAAKAALAGDAEETERWIQAAFDTVSQERDRYCSQQIHLLEVVLLAESTLGEAFSRQLDAPQSIGLLANGSLLRKLHDEKPETWRRLRQKLVASEWELIGGFERDLQSSFSSHWGMDQAFKDGAESYRTLGVEPPTIFSQFAPGWSSLYPDLLLSHGYRGALIQAWSGGIVPEKDSAKIRWQAHSEGDAIDAVLGHVVDASNAETFLHFTSHLSKQLDYHHVPTLVLAHWPDQVADAYADLAAVMKRSPALGSLDRMEKYFTTTNQPYSSDTFQNRQFRIPLVGDASQIAAQQREHLGAYGRFVRTSRLRSLAWIWQNVAPKFITKDFAQSILAIESKAHRCKDCTASAQPDVFHSSEELEADFLNAKSRLLEMIAGAGVATTESGLPNGYLIVNNSSHARRVFLESIPGEIDSGSSTRIVGAVTQGNRSHLVADLPPFGFVKVRAAGLNEAPGSVRPILSRPGVLSKLTGKRPGIADSDWTLANEYLEVQIDPKKGHLRSVFVPNKRGSRMSGMASIVLGEQGAGKKWQEADFLPRDKTEMRLIENSSVRGVIETTGTTVVPGMGPVRLTTRYTLWKGARWIDIDVECDAPHDHRFQCVWRTAWANESATLSAWQQGTKGKLPAPMQATVELVEIDDIENKIYLAAGGLSTHQRFDHRYLVTPLPHDGPRCARFALRLGMDWPRPLETALDGIDPAYWTAVRLASDEVDSGAWLAQSNLPNVGLEGDDPRDGTMWVDEDAPRESFDSLFWVRETRGKRASTKLSFLKNAEEAWRIDAHHRQSTKLDVEDGQVLINLRPSEQCRIAVRWSR